MSFAQLKGKTANSVIPAWRAGIQIDMDVSEASMHTWMPAIHAGMTSSGLSSSVGERKLMNHFVLGQFNWP